MSGMTGMSGSTGMSGKTGRGGRCGVNRYELAYLLCFLPTNSNPPGMSAV
jgi:hypothetical protein